MIDAIVYALLCGLALSAIIVPATALSFRRASATSAATRHAMWLVVLAATVAATCVPLAVSALRPAAPVFETATRTAANGPGNTDIAFVATALALGSWAAVAAVRLVFVVRSIAVLRSLKNRGVPIAGHADLPRGARLLASDVTVPAAVGFRRPAVLLPHGALAELDAIDARQIVAHEAAHVRRRDDITGLAFVVCAAILWFNPFVHYIGKRLALDCEIACDEIAVGCTGDAARYAALLFAVARKSAETRTPLAWSSLARPSGLFTRIEHLLHAPQSKQTCLARPAIVRFAASLSVSVAIFALEAPGIAKTNAVGTRVCPVVTTSDARTRRVLAKSRRVRAFPPCGRSNAAYCDGSPSGVTTSQQHIKKAGFTP